MGINKTIVLSLIKLPDNENVKRKEKQIRSTNMPT